MPETRMIPMGLIVPPPDAMRLAMEEGALYELAADIKRRGLLNPLTVYPEREAAPPAEAMGAPSARKYQETTGMFRIAAGHRRYLALRINGATEAMCLVREGSADDYEGDMIAENMFRENLTPFEEGNRFKEISIRPGMTEEKLQRLCGNKSLPHIYDRIRLVEGDPEVGLAVHENKISLVVAKWLNKINVSWYIKKLGPVTPEQEALLDKKATQHRRYLLTLASAGGCSAAQGQSWFLQWEQTEGLAPAPDPVPQQPAPQTMAPGFVPRCFLCEQDSRPYDLENVYICRGELRAIKVAYDKPIETA